MCSQFPSSSDSSSSFTSCTVRTINRLLYHYRCSCEREMLEKRSEKNCFVVMKCNNGAVGYEIFERIDSLCRTIAQYTFIAIIQCTTSLLFLFFCYFARFAHLLLKEIIFLPHNFSFSVLVVPNLIMNSGYWLRASLSFSFVSLNIRIDAYFR